MAFSLSRLIILESNRITCVKVFETVAVKFPKATQRGTASCVGDIDGFKVWLGFWRGIPSWKCSCVETIHTQSQNPCVHAVALSITWDRNRNVPDPTIDDINFLTGKH